MRFLVALSVVLAAAAAAAGAADDCGPPPHGPGEKHVHAFDCCKLHDVGGAFPAAFRSAGEKCREKMPRPPRPSGPPPPGPRPPPSPEMKNHHACMAECLFTEAGIVKDGKISKEAAMKSFASDNKEVSALVSAALDKCFASYEKDVDPGLECTSGAAELERCATREIFLGCPASLWTDSAECGALKARVERCPMMPVMMMGPPPGHPGHPGPPGPPRPKPN